MLAARRPLSRDRQTRHLCRHADRPSRPAQQCRVLRHRSRAAGDEQPQLLRAEIEAVLTNLARGQLQMMPVTTVPVSQIATRSGACRKQGTSERSSCRSTTRTRWCRSRRVRASRSASDATYLVTGGTAGFGLETARWLVDNGARSLVLAARSRTLTAEAEATLGSLRSGGAAVVVVSADVATRAGVRAALAAVERSGWPLRGIVHAAGTIDDALIEKLAPDRIRRVFTGKVLGAWHLHELTRSARLDFFVVYSSVAATLGSPGQAHYAAANRVLDAIAALRRSQGLPATSIAFGPIGDKGYLARRQDVARYVSGAGMQVLPAAAALAALGGVLRRAPMEVAFAEINWSKLAQTFALIASSPRTSGLAQVSLNGAGGSNQHVRSSIVAASDRQRQDIVADYLRRKVATVLKVEPAAIEFERPLQELGLEFADRVRAEELHRDRAGGRTSRRQIPATADHRHDRPRGRRGDQHRQQDRCHRSRRDRRSRDEHVDRPGSAVVRQSFRPRQSGLWARGLSRVPAASQCRLSRPDHAEFGPAP